MSAESQLADARLANAIMKMISICNDCDSCSCVVETPCNCAGCKERDVKIEALVDSSCEWFHTMKDLRKEIAWWKSCYLTAETEIAKLKFEARE